MIVDSFFNTGDCKHVHLISRVSPVIFLSLTPKSLSIRLFNHQNILKLVGVVLKRRPMCIVTELLAGDLQTSLRNSVYSNEYVGF